MEALIMPAAHVRPGQIIIDHPEAPRYSVGGEALRIADVVEIPPDEFSTDPDGSRRFVFGPGHWLVVEAHADVAVRA